MSDLKDRLYNQEQIPPEEVWKRITAALDESHLQDQFPSKLYNTEVAPPMNAWDRIAGALEPTTPSIGRRNFPLLRYAAAAVLIGLLAFGVVKWMNRGGDKTVDTVAITNEKTNGESKRQNEPPTNTSTQDVATLKQDNVAPKNTEPAITAIKKSRIRDAEPADNDIAPTFAYNEHTPSLADRYIMYMTPDGGIVRMSKKWGSLVCCVSGQEQDEDCKDQIKKWQEKLACAPVANGNFMDILSLVNSLNTDL